MLVYCGEQFRDNLHEWVFSMRLLSAFETVIDLIDLPERFRSCNMYRQVCFKCFNSHRVPFVNDGSCARQLALRPSVLTFQAISLAGGHVISINNSLQDVLVCYLYPSYFHYFAFNSSVLYSKSRLVFL